MCNHQTTHLTVGNPLTHLSRPNTKSNRTILQITRHQPMLPALTPRTTHHKCSNNRHRIRHRCPGVATQSNHQTIALQQARPNTVPTLQSQSNKTIHPAIRRQWAVSAHSSRQRIVLQQAVFRNKPSHLTNKLNPLTHQLRVLSPLCRVIVHTCRKLSL